MQTRASRESVGREARVYLHRERRNDHGEIEAEKKCEKEIHLRDNELLMFNRANILWIADLRRREGQASSGKISGTSLATATGMVITPASPQLYSVTILPYLYSRMAETDSPSDKYCP